MYGLVNKAIEQMVCLHHGEGAWERIKTRAGVDADLFLSNEQYPDDVTYRLVGAASEELRVPADAVLKSFGEHWIRYTAQEGYGAMIRSAGRSLPEFLTNLPNFHTRVNMIFPNLQPPKFRVTDLTDRSLDLHYLTHRPGLAPFVVGLLEGLGALFETPVTVRQTASRDQGAEWDVFRVTWQS